MAKAAESSDQKAAAQAYAKVARGEKLSDPEKAAIRRYEKAREEVLRWQYYETIPQKHWRAMTGRQTKVLNEQAERYGLPFGGAVIHLPKLAKALHDFLAANAMKLASEDALMNGGSSPALERYRDERAIMAKLDRQEREGELLPREHVRDALGRIAATIRTAGDILGRQFGNEAQDILVETLNDAEEEIQRIFGSNG